MQFKNFNSRQTAIAVGAFLCLLGALLLVFPAPCGRLLLHGYLQEQSAGLVDEALEDNVKGFAAVSAVKAALALVEGSSVGVGFDLQVGDLVQPAYDYVDFVWRVFLWATFILMTYKILLETGILGLGIQLAGVGLILLAM
ncbi:hypothetical protein HQ520_17005, partial [bacterium]|nr:hypothetical protein [bacterium]